MLAIFLASSQPAEASGALSGSLTQVTIGNLWQLIAPNGREMPVEMLDACETVLRKGAHLFAFFVLGFCVANAVRQLDGNKRRVFWISLCWSSAYGAIDELHQYFVPGRACMWQDWLIDTVGAALGVCFVCYFMRMKKKR